MKILEMEQKIEQMFFYLEAIPFESIPLNMRFY